MLYSLTQTRSTTDFRSSSEPGSNVSALVVGKPGHLLEGLSSLLKAHPRLDVQGSAADVPSAMKFIKERQPGLVLFDYTLPEEEIVEGIRCIKQEWPQISCIVATERNHQYHKALTAGADDALLKGFPADRLFSVVNRLLLRRCGSSGAND